MTFMERVSLMLSCRSHQPDLSFDQYQFSLVVPKDSSTYRVYNGSASTTDTSMDWTHQVLFRADCADKTSYTGLLIQDSLTIGGDLCISDAILGAVDGYGNTHSATSVQEGSANIKGVWGLGFRKGESDPQYPSILSRMKELTFIDIEAYSLWLHDRDATTGTILFGGVDTAKFEGPLIGLPLRHKWGETSFTAFNIQLTRVMLMDEDHPNLDISPIEWNVVPGVPALPNSGTTWTILPEEIARQIILYVGGTDISLPNDPSGPQILVPCNLKHRNMNITFQFGGWNGPKISVPIHEFINRHHFKHAPGHHNGHHQCIFGLVGHDKDTAILGDTFLRSAYLVYDLENKRIAMAQSRNTDESSIQAITNDTIPGMSTVLDPLPTPTTTRVASITVATTFYSSVGAVSLGGCVVHTSPVVDTECWGYVTQIPAGATASVTG